MTDYTMTDEQLNINDLELTDLEVAAEDDSYALPEAGASVGKNSCTVIIQAD